jgi:L-asparaginase II
MRPAMPTPTKCCGRPNVIVGEVRSGLVEARHPVAVVAVDGAGRRVAAFGDDVDRPFFFRSAAKPFQGHIAQRLGAGLAPEQLAVACSSHGGQPVHLAYVSGMLAGAGLEESALLCPPAWPRSESSNRRVAAAGLAARPLFHNCSGKHAAMLRACVSQGWSADDYTDPDHPLQRALLEYASDVTREELTPVGVDGCGVPTFRVTVSGLAAAYSRLATDPDLAEVADAMYRFSSLTSDGGFPEAELARWVPGPVKGGARGCVGLAWYGGLGIAAKASTGETSVAVIGIIEMLRRLCLLSAYPEEALAQVARPAVLGGGRPVGELVPIADHP